MRETGSLVLYNLSVTPVPPPLSIIRSTSYPLKIEGKALFLKF